MKSVDALTEQQRLLRIEYEEEERDFRQLTDSTGVDGLVARGMAKTPVKFNRTFFNNLNNRIAEVIFPSSGDEESDDDHKFEPGVSVSFFRINDDSKIEFLIPGRVSYVDGQRVGIELRNDSRLDKLESENLGLMVSFDKTTYFAMFEAIKRAISAKGRLGELRDIIYSGRPMQELKLTPVTLKYLNESQNRGVNKILRAKEVAIVHGPPGTGKTTTLVEAIYETLRREPQVLVCAQSNMAIDWISEKLIDRGVNVLRIGNPKRITDKMLPYTYEQKFGDHPDCATLAQVMREISALRGKRGETRNYSQKMGRLRERATELQIRINNDIFNSSNVIACTLTGADNKLLDGKRFTTLFIDEAAQALEPACWIPMRRAQRVILAGDHYQLPATVRSYQAMKEGLGVSLMERIAKLHPECVTTLQTQYRMHRDIMQFPNLEFYGGEMNADSSVSGRSIIPMDIPMEWVDTAEMGEDDNESQNNPENCDTHENEKSEESSKRDFREQLVGESGGKINRDEALLTIVVLMKYIKRIGEKRILEENIDFGLISPYRAQVQYLRKIIKRIPALKKIRKRISINTVDGFQGQERDVIVISTVRSNEEGNIGFLGDIRRMNVAITRARKKVIIIGNSKTLTHTRFYRRLFKYVTGLNGKYRARIFSNENVKGNQDITIENASD